MNLHDVDTPFTVIDHDRLITNLERHHTRTRQQGIASRPHAKTHKIPELAKLQIDHGARGVTLATLGEAEVFVDAGIEDIFLAYPLWLTPNKARRLVALSDRATIALGVDSVAGANQAALGLSGTSIEFMIEVDSGHHRSGIDPHNVVPVAEALAKHGLTLRGVFTYPGHSYDPQKKDTASVDEVKALGVATTALESAGYSVAERSGGSTPSLHTTQSFLTETRAGVYALGDAQQLELGTMKMDDLALSVVTTVVNARGHTVVVDAGSKIMGADKAPWASGHGRVLGHPDARLTAMSEHHATIVFPENSPPVVCGDLLRVVPNHVCNAVNLVDSLAVADGSIITKWWKVAARGKNS
ncbi:MAG: D-serine deaminase-like pyridoxal phosphate-dependent protein [Pontimonas sp.]|jgi:D-serine deaminase-like pyridoxal phosphate-dependent protein